MKTTVGLSLPEYSFNTSHTVLIIGAGLAGCAIAHKLASRGYSCKVYDQHSTIASATSALPAAVVRPAISGDDFFRSYFDYAFDLCCQSLNSQSSNHQSQRGDLFTQCGSLELTSSLKKHSTQNKDIQNKNTQSKKTTSNSHTIYSGAYRRELIDIDKASTLAGTKLNSSAIHIEDAGFVNPQLLCEHWLQRAAVEFYGATAVEDLRKTQHGWQLLSESGLVIDESHIVVLATADRTDQFDVTAELPLQRAAGQIDLFEHQGSGLQCIINGNGYLLPVEGGIWCGATHHPVQSSGSNIGGVRGVDLLPESRVGSRVAPLAESPNGSQVDSRADLQAYSKADSLANRAKIAGILPALSFTGSPVSSFAAVRTFTPDRLPIVGAVHDTPRYRENYADLKHGKPASYFPAPDFHQGLYLATGLGSRGATQALLIGELLSDLISGFQHKEHPGNQLHQHLLQALHPARFLVRALKRESYR